MDVTPNKYISAAYELYAENGEGQELVEKAPESRPFCFITGLGIALDAFEAALSPMKEGESFDFILTKDQAYGDYEPERVLEVSKETFNINGHFDDMHVYAGSVVPLTNADGARFNGTVIEVKDETVTLDLNHPLAGKSLRFVGKITESREATKEEIEAQLAMLRGEGCGCGNCREQCGKEEHQCRHDCCRAR